MDDLMPIGEFSERSGLSAKRLRSYAAAGLLVPAAIDSTSSYRYYAPGQLREAQLIGVLRAAGMPLADIGSFLREPSADHLDAWTRQVELDAAQRQEALELARHLLAADTAPSASAAHHQPRRTGMTTLKAAGRTDIGRVRAHNQDVVVASERLAAVADGMGGHQGGDVAAGLAATLVRAAFTGRSADELRAAVRAANRAIWDRACETTYLEGMGTTICAAGLTGDGILAIVHVGDSRAYVVQDGELRQLTEDHTVTGELVQRGELSEHDARHHPHRHVLTRALGVGPDVEPESLALRLSDGDRLLLCTDGLFNEVDDDDIASAMATTGDIEATADALVDLALSRGGNDNVSVVVAELRR